jgi:IclR family pca regulon transcriptional regulator
MELREISAPHLQRLSDEVGHTVNMAILDGADIVYIERCRSSGRGQREIDLNLHVGSRLPAYCTSMGKAMLAFLPEDERNAAIERVQFSRLGPNTRTSRQALLKDLERVRATGIAVNDEELAYGLRSIAAPVRSQTGEVVAAINLAVHRSLVSMDDLFDDLAAALVDTADEIAAHIGFRQVTYGRR